MLQTCQPSLFCCAEMVFRQPAEPLWNIRPSSIRGIIDNVTVRADISHIHHFHCSTLLLLPGRGNGTVGQRVYQKRQPTTVSESFQIPKKRFKVRVCAHSESRLSAFLPVHQQITWHNLAKSIGSAQNFARALVFGKEKGGQPGTSRRLD